MKLRIDKSFEKDTDEITDKKLLESIADCIKEVRSISKLSDIKNCRKLKGSKIAFRIKIDKYRIGFEFKKQTVEFIRCLPRDKIYTKFP